MATYTAMLLDKGGFTITDGEVYSLKEAKAWAKQHLSISYAELVESSHEKLGTHKVEIHD
jgi:hypothetical protein